MGGPSFQDEYELASAQLAEAMSRDITDCDGDGCGECDVCEYLDFIEYAEAVAPPGSRIIRDREIEKILKRHENK